MQAAVSVYTDYVLSLSHHSGQEFELWIEQKFDLSSVYAGCFGTADAVVYHPATKVLHVIDLKYGQGIAVEARENTQLQYYGLGALIAARVPCETVTMTIVQPRCDHPAGPVRSWSMPAVEMLHFAADLADFARATENPNAAVKPGEWCRFCPAAPVCPSLNEKAVAAAKKQFSPVGVSPEELAKALDMVPHVEAWIKSVREYAYGEAEHGRTPPGYKLVAKRAVRKWKDESQAARFLELGRYVDGAQLYEQPSLKSPAQIEKLVGKKKFSEACADLVVQESSGYTLVAESDSRESINKDPSAQFTVIETTGRPVVGGDPLGLLQ